MFMGKVDFCFDSWAFTLHEWFSKHNERRNRGVPSICNRL